MTGPAAVGRRRPAAAGASVAAALVATAVVVLASAGRRWETIGASGAVATQPGWAALVAVAWLAAAVAHVRDPAARVTPAIVGAAGCVTAGALLVATVRLVGVLRDGTTVADLTPTVAGWSAPVVLAVLLVAVAASPRLPGPWRVAVAAAGTVGLTAGIVLGLLPVATATGRLDRPADHARVWGVRPSAVRADVLAPVGDAVYVAEDGALLGLDARGRVYPVARFDDLRPEGYVGHRTDAGADAIDDGDVVGLFARPGAAGLVVATRRAVFTALGEDGGRLLLVLTDDRTQVSLATATAAGSGVVPGATRILGAGPAREGGIVVATDRGLVHRAADGVVTPWPAADAVLLPAEPDGGPRRVVVHGRPDGSAVLGLPCVVYDVAPGGQALTTLADWRGAGCTDTGPPALAVDAVGLVTVLREARTATGPGALDQPPVPDSLLAVDARGRRVAWYPDGRFLRSPEAR